MLIPLAPTTLAFAPSRDDLEDISFGTPVTQYHFTPPPQDNEESEQGEP